MCKLHSDSGTCSSSNCRTGLVCYIFYMNLRSIKSRKIREISLYTHTYGRYLIKKNVNGTHIYNNTRHFTLYHINTVISLLFFNYFS